jgi:hypothetical protein
MDDPAFLLAQVYESDALQIRLRFEALATNFFIFERNYQEMVKWLVAVQHPNTIDILWAQDKQQDMTTALREVSRLLHNLVASAKTLVDHTRSLIRHWYADSEFLQEYQSEVENRFVGNQTAGFVEELRNYALHYQLPPMTALLEVGRDSNGRLQPPTQTIALDKAGLLQWSGWRKGRPYLDAASDRIALREVIEQYFQNVRDFHQWIQDRLVETHADELRWLEDKRKRIKEVLSRSQEET